LSSADFSALFGSRLLDSPFLDSLLFDSPLFGSSPLGSSGVGCPGISFFAAVPAEVFFLRVDVFGLGVAFAAVPDSFSSVEPSPVDFEVPAPSDSFDSGVGSASEVSLDFFVELAAVPLFFFGVAPAGDGDALVDFFSPEDLEDGVAPVFFFGVAEALEVELFFFELVSAPARGSIAPPSTMLATIAAASECRTKGWMEAFTAIASDRK
jgi:hypothetical protein